jgi:16S rRNA (uracil1498-N3)-methyltransferase
VPFQEILNKCCNNSLKIMLWEDEKNTTLKEVLQSNRPSKRIVALVGPEGGFTADEVNMSRQAGFKSVSLGRYVLRTETAALCLLGILEYEWGEPGRIDLTTEDTEDKIN